ncbi:MAG: ankyrin repeat domain-containing protein [Planctomycetota bacterium]
MSDAKQRFVDAINAQDAEALAALLDSDGDVAGLINEPIGYFGGRALHAAVKHRPTLDVLLDRGADPNLASDWSEGPFTVLDQTDEATVRHLLTRGATLTPHVAARLGWTDELTAMLDADPHRVHERGGDGKRPLHWAGTVAIADLLLDRLADIDARCTDHTSTPVQYLLKDHPDVARHLLERGATPDIFATVFLGDLERTRQQLDENPKVSGHRIGHDGYNRVPSGTMYQWILGYGLSPLDLAAETPDMLALLCEHADAKTRFLAAAARGDREAADAEELPSLETADHALLGDAIRRGNNDAVRLMLEFGFDPTLPYRGLDNGTALHVAAWFGRPELVRMLLEDGRCDLEARDGSHGATVLSWACHGAVHCRRDDPVYVDVVQMLIDAGSETDIDAHAGGSTLHAQAAGRPDVQAVLASVTGG